MILASPLSIEDRHVMPPAESGREEAAG